MSVTFVPGTCCVCSRDAPGADVFCPRCWWDVADDDRRAAKMAFESPIFEKGGKGAHVEYVMVLAGAAEALIARRMGRARAS